MLITVDFTSHTPIYTQLRDQVVIGIASRALLPGEALPSVRRLAADIGVHAHTVNKAYAILQSEGYIAIDRRSGCHVSPEFPAADERFEQALREQLLPIVAAAAARGIEPGQFQTICCEIFQSLEAKA